MEAMDRVRMMSKYELLVPMSMEDLKIRQYKNVRKKFLQLYFVNSFGEDCCLITSEIKAYGLDKKWPRYMKTNLGIKTINKMRRGEIPC